MLFFKSPCKVENIEEIFRDALSELKEEEEITPDFEVFIPQSKKEEEEDESRIVNNITLGNAFERGKSEGLETAGALVILQLWQQTKDPGGDAS